MSLKISRILHAGYLFEDRNIQIAFDPIFENPFSQNCYAYPRVEFDQKQIQKLKLDAVFISHYHDDHFSLESLNLLNRKTPIYLFAYFDELFRLLEDLGFHNVTPLELGHKVSIGRFEVLPLQALDEDVDSIFHIQVSDLNVLHVVDSWIPPKTLDRLLKLKWDLVLWPFQTMREIEVLSPTTATNEIEFPIEWVEQIRKLKPRVMVPSSCQFRFEDWSWYNRVFFPISYHDFEKQILHISPATKVLKLNPGESILLNRTKVQTHHRLPWIIPIGDQNVDYEFQKNTRPQTISEISKMFPELNEAQNLRIKNYCQKEILDRFQSLTDLETCLHWKLILYDHQGFPKNYYYSIQNNQIEIAPEFKLADWTTEISETKLWGALEEGESLTSIYLRVTPKADTDPLEDPLIRCLYEGQIGHYQKAQLKRLFKNAPSSASHNDLSYTS